MVPYGPIEAQDYPVGFLVATTKYEFSIAVGLDTSWVIRVHRILLVKLQ
jgi:hypothetical protein